MSHNRKHVRQQFGEYPEPEPGQQLARVVESRGSNQVEIELADGERKLVLIPSKCFHKVVFLKRGDVVIVQLEPDPSKLAALGKIHGTVVTPLHAHQLKHLAGRGLLPSVWAAEWAPAPSRSVEDMMPPESDEDDELVGGNLNRRSTLSSDDDDEDE